MGIRSDVKNEQSKMTFNGEGAPEQTIRPVIGFSLDGEGDWRSLKANWLRSVSCFTCVYLHRLSDKEVRCPALYAMWYVFTA